MNGPFTGSAFPEGGRGFDPSRLGEGIKEAADQLRHAVDRKVGGRLRPRSVRSTLLVLLAEGPNTGHGLLAEIEDRTSGSWSPGAGEVYPTLQLLTDEGLVMVSEEGGRRTYTLSSEGQGAAEAIEPAPWDGGSSGGGGRGRGALPKAGVELAQATALLGRSGSPEQIQEAVEVLDEARRRLHAILAED